MKKLMLVLNFILIAALLLAGCTPTAPTTAVPPAATEAPAQPPPTEAACRSAYRRLPCARSPDCGFFEQPAANCLSDPWQLQSRPPPDRRS